MAAITPIRTDEPYQMSDNDVVLQGVSSEDLSTIPTHGVRMVETLPHEDEETDGETDDETDNETDDESDRGAHDGLRVPDAVNPEPYGFPSSSTHRHRALPANETATNSDYDIEPAISEQNCTLSSWWYHSLPLMDLNHEDDDGSDYESWMHSCNQQRQPSQSRFSIESLFGHIGDEY